MHNVIPEQQEHVVERVGAEVACIVPTPKDMSRMVIEMIYFYPALSIVDLKCCGGAGVV